MEAKKNPDKDVNRKSGQFFLIGLSISVSLMITAFEWRTEVTQIPFDPPRSEDPIILTEIPVPKINIPKQVQDVSIKPKSPSLSFTPIEVSDSSPDDNIDPTPRFNLDSLAYSDVGISTTDAPEENDSLYIIVEKKPEPVNGFEGFYKDISQRTKYPRQARQMEVEGKVYVEFIVNRKGDPTEFRVVKGIGAGCDQEAMRVIALSKWEPGKQRGIAVRVKMVMPVYFKLNN